MDPGAKIREPNGRPGSPAASHASEEESHYSLNLDALPFGKDESSIAMDNQADDLIEVIGTDDIDGPTDFTQNMQYWMSLKLPNLTTPTTMQGLTKLELEQYVSSEEPGSSSDEISPVPSRHPSIEPRQPNLVDIRGTITRQSHDYLIDDWDQRQQSLQDHQQERANILLHVDGASDKDNISRDSGPPKHLQPSVEDLEESFAQVRSKSRPVTPSCAADTLRRRPSNRHLRHSSVQLPQSHDLLSNDLIESLEQALEQVRLELESFKKASRATIEALQINHTTQLHDKETIEAQLRELLQQEITKNSKVSNEMIGLRESHKNLQAEVEQAASTIDQLRLESTALNKVIIEQHDAQEYHSKGILDELASQHVGEFIKMSSNSNAEANTRFTAQMTELETALTGSQRIIREQLREITNLQKQLNGRNENYQIAQKRAKQAECLLEEMIQDHQDDMQHEQQIHDMQVVGLEERASSLNNELNLTRQQIGRLQKRLKDCKDELSVVQRELEVAKNIHTVYEDRVKALETQHATTSAELVIMEDALRKTENRIFNITTEHDLEMKGLSAAHSREKEDMQSKADLAVLRLTNLVVKERSEVKRLRDDIYRANHFTNPELAELQDLRNQIRVTNDLVNDMRKERQDLRKVVVTTKSQHAAAAQQTCHAQADLEKARTELELLGQERRAIDEAVNSEVIKLMRIKEQEWKNKFHAMGKELQMRNKLLMVQWGRDEIGSASPQGYKYKYLLKEELQI